MLILAILVLGLAAGWIGIAGSFVGGLMASLVFGDGLALRPSGLIGSILGATLMLLVVRALWGGPARQSLQ